jgi:hypothetical protein
MQRRGGGAVSREINMNSRRPLIPDVPALNKSYSYFGAQFVSSTERAQLRDTMPMIGSAMMSVCALAFLLAAILAITHSARKRAFTWTHGLVIVVAGLVTLVAGIDGAYPR